MKQWYIITSWADLGPAERKVRQLNSRSNIPKASFKGKYIYVRSTYAVERQKVDDSFCPTGPP